MDPERLLGSLIFGGLGRALPGGNRAALGMGLLGVAIAAIEHISQQSQGRPAPPPPPPAPGGHATPPPPPRGASAEAMLLVRAMIAAAHADGRLDDEERSHILERAQRGGLSVQEGAAVAAEMDTPLAAAELAAQVTAPEQAEQVYAASLLALRVDTDAEHAYLADLAARLGLSPATVNRIHSLLGA
jgi:uncharacterized membrane protein YebE (DUF533 family)